MLDTEVVPLLRKCSLAGHAEYKTQNPVRSKEPALVTPRVGYHRLVWTESGNSAAISAGSQAGFRMI